MSSQKKKKKTYRIFHCQESGASWPSQQDRRGQWCVLEPLFSFSFFLQLFHFFILLVPPSSSLFLPRPALSKSLRICKRPFFIDFDKSVTNGQINQRTDQPTDKASNRDARTHLKKEKEEKKFANSTAFLQARFFTLLKMNRIFGKSSKTIATQFGKWWNKDQRPTMRP